MRESGIEFLGEVPAHWDVQPAVTLARVLTSTVDKKSYEGERPVKLCNYTDVYYSDQIMNSSDFMVATATSEQVAKFSVRAGDVPFTKDSETADDIGIPSYVPEDLPGTVYGYHLSIFRPNDKRRGRFLKYLLESDYAKAYFEAKTPGVTRVGLGQATIRYFRAPTPPVDEAVAIADYLERETAQIDAFVAKNEELIALISERRASSIAEQIGKYATIPLKRLVSSRRPLTYGILQVGEPVEFGAPYLLPANFIGEGASPRLSSLLHTTPEIAAPYARAIVKSGDIVITIGPGYGRVGRITPELDGVFLTRDTVRIASDSTKVSADYLIWVLSSQVAFNFWDRTILGSTFRRLNVGTLGDTPIPLPQLGEQSLVVGRIAGIVARADAAIATARRTISLARERRAALISAAVTGKIDVGVTV